MVEIDVILNDKDFYLKFVIKDADGNAEDISGSTCELHVRKYGGTTVYSFTGDWGDYPTDPDDPNPAEGEVRFAMGTITWDGAGDYDGEIEVTYSDGSVVTVPDIIFHVLEEIG